MAMPDVIDFASTLSSTGDNTATAQDPSAANNATNPLGQKKSSEDKFWERYLDVTHTEEKTRAEEWDGNAGSLLTFIGLFGVIVAAFVIESYKSLRPDSGDQTVDLLNKSVALLSQMVAASTNSSVPSPTLGGDTLDPFRASVAAVISNALWFSSLSVTLACALLATLVQQWSRDYVRDMEKQRSLGDTFRDRALNHITMRLGVDRFKFIHIVYLTVGLVHLAVFLFAAGLVLFLLTVNSIVAWTTAAIIFAFATTYLIASFWPVYDNNCPYRTPLTYLFVFAVWLILHFIALSPFSHITFLRNVQEPGYNWLRDLTHRRWNTQDNSPVSLRAWRASSRPFKFAWRRLKRHIFPGIDFPILLQSTVSILGIYSREHDLVDCVDYLEKDAWFTNQLHDYNVSSETAGPDTDIAALQMLCFRMRAIEIRSSDFLISDSRMFVDDCLKILGRIHRVDENARSTLLTRLCLFRLRWLLLRLCLQCWYRIEPLESKSDEPFIALDNDALHSELKKHKKSLIQLNSRRYNRVDSERFIITDWEQRPRGSCLVPLHNAECCKSPHRVKDADAWAHVAACNALTMISYLIHASSGSTIKDRTLPTQPDVDPIWMWWKDSPESPFIDWETLFHMNAADCKLPPSREFVGLLREIGLEDWLKLGRSTSQPRNGPHIRDVFEQSWIPGIPLLQLVEHVLWTLVQCVDMTAIPPSGDDDYQVAYEAASLRVPEWSFAADIPSPIHTIFSLPSSSTSEESLPSQTGQLDEPRNDAVSPENPVTAHDLEAVTDRTIRPLSTSQGGREEQRVQNRSLSLAAESAPSFRDNDGSRSSGSGDVGGETRSESPAPIPAILESETVSSARRAGDVDESVVEI